MTDKKHFFFDMDGTITQSRQKISDDMRAALSALQRTGRDVIVISGAAGEQIGRQLDGCPVSYMLAQSGNDSPFWKKIFTAEEKEEVLDHLRGVKDHYGKKNVLGPEEDLLQDRGSQMSFSFLGHNADIEKKKLFDPTGTFRREVLENFPFMSALLECRIGGTTCLDYTRQDSTKGKNIEKLVKHVGWKKNECVYFGDALFPGGNDETVIGIIETVEVKNPEEMLSLLTSYK